MESFVNWWCHLIGITDTMAIQVATGVMGGGLALLIALIFMDHSDGTFRSHRQPDFKLRHYGLLGNLTKCRP
jgi:hypothetical protein